MEAIICNIYKILLIYKRIKQKRCNRLESLLWYLVKVKSNSMSNQNSVMWRSWSKWDQKEFLLSNRMNLLIRLMQTEMDEIIPSMRRSIKWVVIYTTDLDSKLFMVKFPPYLVWSKRCSIRIIKRLKMINNELIRKSSIYAIEWIYWTDYSW